MLKIEFKFEYTNKESVTHFSQLISITVTKSLRKYQAQFPAKLRFRLRKNDSFLILKSVFQMHLELLTFINVHAHNTES